MSGVVQPKGARPRPSRARLSRKDKDDQNLSCIQELPGNALASTQRIFYRLLTAAVALVLLRREGSAAPLVQDQLLSSAFISAQ